ncbi:MAG: hypothetical protein JW841_08255 [Deltaproteobacteria bacterium]|nr:hypothetical protein [Deltaproteobacteria bacterium]
MPILLNFAVNIGLGGLIVLSLQRSPALHREFISWPLLALILFESLFFTPLATYLFRFYPQWSMLYLFDPQIFPQLEHWFGFISFLAVLLNYLGAIAGFFITRKGVLLGKTWLAYLSTIIAGLIILIGSIIFNKRLIFIGEYDAFWQDQAALFVTQLAGWLGILMYISVAAFILLLRSRFANHDPKFF